MAQWEHGGGFSVDRIAALVSPPRLQHHYCYSACWRERPQTGNFCGDTERPVLAELAHW